MRPGSTVALPRSITVVPVGIGRLAPTAVMRELSTRMTAFWIGAPPRPSMSRAARMARWRAVAEASGPWAPAPPTGRHRPRSIKAELRVIGKPRRLRSERSAEHRHRFDLEQELGPYQAGNDQGVGGRMLGIEIAGSNLS